jgi:hypothetical protein
LPAENLSGAQPQKNLPNPESLAPVALQFPFYHVEGQWRLAVLTRAVCHIHENASGREAP